MLDIHLESSLYGLRTLLRLKILPNSRLSNSPGDALNYILRLTIHELGKPHEPTIGRFSIFFSKLGGRTYSEVVFIAQKTVFINFLRMPTKHIYIEIYILVEILS